MRIVKSMSSVVSDSSDLDIEDINPALDLVTFDDLHALYEPGQDIFVVYELGPNFAPRSRDWVGLYKKGWTNPEEYLTFQWAQKFPRNEKFPMVRSVLFQSKYLPTPTGNDCPYQFLYVAKGNQVAGISNLFGIGSSLPDSLVWIERSLSSSSVTMVESQLKDAVEDNLGTFELVQVSSRPKSNQSEIIFTEQPATLTDDFPDLTDTQIFGLLNAPDSPNVIPQSARSIDHETLFRDFPDYSSTQIFKILNTETPGNDQSHLTSVLPVQSQPEHISQPPTSGERSLVPYTSRAVVPYTETLPLYSADSKKGIKSVTASDSVYGILKDLLSLLNVPQHSLCMPPRKPVKMRSVTCSKCQTLAREIREVRARCRVMQEKCVQLQRQLDSVDENVELKDILVEELSDQVKNLVYENGKLKAINEKMYRESCAAWNLQEENRRLQESAAATAARTEELTTAQATLISHNTVLEDIVVNLRAENSALKMKNSTLEMDQTCLQTEHFQLERHLDDIMYTLATQNFTAIVNPQGQKVDVTNYKQGRVLELQDWNLVVNKKTEKRLVTQSIRQETVQKLQACCSELESQLSRNTAELERVSNELQESQSFADKLRSEIGSLENNVASLTEKESSLSAILIDERRIHTSSTRDFLEQKQQLEDRIMSLEDAVAAAQLIQKHKTNICTQAGTLSTVACREQNVDINFNDLGARPKSVPIAAIKPRKEQVNTPCDTPFVSTLSEDASDFQPDTSRKRSWYSIVETETKCPHPTKYPSVKGSVQQTNNQRKQKKPPRKFVYQQYYPGWARPFGKSKNNKHNFKDTKDTHE